MEKHKKDSVWFLPALPNSIKNVPWGVRDAVLITVWVFTVAPVLAFVLFQVTGLSIPTIKPYFSAQEDKEYLLTFYWGIFTLLGIFFMLRRNADFLKYLGFKKFPIKPALATLIAASLFMYALSYAIPAIAEHLLPSYDPATETLNMNDAANWLVWWVVLIGSVGVMPIVEETLFRGYIFPVLARKLGWVAGAIIISLVFGLGHLSPIATPLTFTAGLILCYMYIRFQSIIPGIILHMVNNLSVALIAMPK